MTHGESAQAVETVRCVCGRFKQRDFICDFCYSTDDDSGGSLPLHNRPDGGECNYAAMTTENGQWVCTKCGAGGSTTARNGGKAQ